MDLLPVETALQRVLDGVRSTPAEIVALSEAGGRVLAEPVIALRRQPSFDASVMDGYAFRAADTGAGTRLRIVGEAAAGKGFASPLAIGEAVRIFTGAPLPVGADAVLAQEHAAIDGSELVMSEAIVTGHQVRPAGFDFDVGSELLPAGRRIGAREMALIAAGNHADVGVRRKPRVAVLSIGDELVLPGTDPGADETIATNAFAIVELARDAGAEVTDLGIVPDRADDVAAAAGAIDVDILVTIGGASVGDHDVTKPGLAAAGMELAFWRIAMRPGKPLVFGRLGDTSVLGLPGNPVSSFVCGLVFLRPLIATMLGLPRADGEEPAVLGVDVKPNGERTNYLRARIEPGAGGVPHVYPMPFQDSSLLSVLAGADCLLIRPAFAEAADAGAACRIIRL